MLSKQEIKKLKQEAHHLKAELNIGKDGFSKIWLKSLYQAFNTKELLKVKVLDNSASNRFDVKAEVEKLKDIELVQVVGNVLTLYKKLDEKK